jgi:hypothetical protein
VKLELLPGRVKPELSLHNPRGGREFGGLSTGSGTGFREIPGRSAVRVVDCDGTCPDCIPGPSTDSEVPGRVISPSWSTSLLRVVRVEGSRSLVKGGMVW